MADSSSEPPAPDPPRDSPLPDLPPSTSCTVDVTPRSLRRRSNNHRNSIVVDNHLLGDGVMNDLTALNTPPPPTAAPTHLEQTAESPPPPQDNPLPPVVARNKLKQDGLVERLSAGRRRSDIPTGRHSRSPSMFQQTIHKDGYLCGRPDQFRLTASKLDLRKRTDKSWRVVRALLKGTKLSFYDADNDFTPFSTSSTSKSDISGGANRPLDIARLTPDLFEDSLRSSLFSVSATNSNVVTPKFEHFHEFYDDSQSVDLFMVLLEGCIYVCRRTPVRAEDDSATKTHSIGARARRITKRISTQFLKPRDELINKSRSYSALDNSQQSLASSHMTLDDSIEPYISETVLPVNLFSFEGVTDGCVLMSIDGAESRLLRSKAPEVMTTFLEQLNAALASPALVVSDAQPIIAVAQSFLTEYFQAGQDENVDALDVIFALLEPVAILDLVLSICDDLESASVVAERLQHFLEQFKRAYPETDFSSIMDLIDAHQLQIVVDMPAPPSPYALDEDLAAKLCKPWSAAVIGLQGCVSGISVSSFLKLDNIDVARLVITELADNGSNAPATIQHLFSTWYAITRDDPSNATRSSPFFPLSQFIHGFSFNVASRSQPICLMMHHQICVASRTLSDVQRARLISKWIAIGEILRNEFMATDEWAIIAAGILNSRIARLSATWKNVSQDVVDTVRQWNNQLETMIEFRLSALVTDPSYKGLPNDGPLNQYLPVVRKISAFLESESVRRSQALYALIPKVPCKLVHEHPSPSILHLIYKNDTERIAAALASATNALFSDSLLCQPPHFHLPSLASLPPGMIAITDISQYFACFSTVDQINSISGPGTIITNERHDLVLSDQNGKIAVEAATQGRLLDTLVQGGAVDASEPTEFATTFANLSSTDLKTVFFAVYRTFMQPTTLLDGLKQRWNASVDAQRAVVIDLLEYWITSYWIDFADNDRLLMSFLEFCHKNRTTSDKLGQFIDRIRVCVRLPLRFSSAIKASGSPSPIVMLTDDHYHEVFQSLHAVAQRLFDHVSVSEWLQIATLISLSAPSMAIAYGARSLVRSDNDDDTVEIYDIMTAFSLLHIPSDCANKADEHRHDATWMPFMTKLPGNIRALYYLAENVRVWAIHQVLSASSLDMRILRIRLLLRFLSESTRTFGPQNAIADAVMNGLLSPQSRAFRHAWSVVLENKSYLADFEQAIVVPPGSSSRTFPSFRVILERFAMTVSSCPDTLMCTNQDGRPTLSTPVPGTGPTLVNFAKRLRMLQLVELLKPPSTTTDVSPLLNFWYIADMTADRPSFMTDLRTALAVASAENERDTLPPIIAILLEQNQSVSKRRDREFKRLEGVYEKDREKVKKEKSKAEKQASKRDAKSADAKLAFWPRVRQSRSKTISIATTSDTVLPGVSLNDVESSLRMSDTALNAGSSGTDEMPLEKPIKVISILNSRAMVAIEYTKRPNVFRIVTEDGEEVMLQSPSMEEMLSWVKILVDTNAEGQRKTGSTTDISASSGDVSEKPKKSMRSTLASMLKVKDRFGSLRFEKPRKAQVQESPRCPVFGIDLVAVVCREQDVPSDQVETMEWTDDNAVPLIVVKCLDEVERRGMEEVGIYRISGTASTVRELKNDFDSDSEAVKLESYGDINVVTGALKLYFREMPDPIFPFHFFDMLMAIADHEDHDEKLMALKSLLRRLQRPHFFTLKRLAEHLDHVTEYESTNHMVASNIAIVFGPTLIRPPAEEWYAARTDVATPADVANPMRHLGRCNAIVKLLILHHHWLFDDDAGDGGGGAATLSSSVLPSSDQPTDQ